MRSIARPAARRAAAAGVLSVMVIAAAPARAQRGRTAPVPAPPAGLTLDSAQVRGLEWRNIGPFRGGRVTTVAGVPTDVLTYYMGATGGGVWKTEDAGISWKNISDGWFKTGSVGSIGIAPSNPRVIYVGMGEAPVRGVSSSEGDGVYKSTDGGKRWTHLGLEKTKTISRVLVHPQDENTVYVAAQGTRWAPSTERGIYRSSDGGKTWKKIFYVDSISGPAELSLDPTNPRVLYTASWDHQRLPWKVRSGGPGSGLWKSTDGGDTWTRLTKGLPKLIGKSSIQVSPANPERVFAMIEAEDGGFFRSDDAGESWTRLNDDRILRARAWYYIHLIADPKDPERVFVMNSPALKSTDGGKTFTVIPTQHGDHHALWVNPLNTKIWIKGDDGGAQVTMNDGASWSTMYNQPTAQFYRVNTDNLFPYHVYGGQQDNSSIMTVSRTNRFGIGERDWTDVGGCESAIPAFDPEHPVKVYSGCYQGLIQEHDVVLGRGRGIQPYAQSGLSVPSDQLKYRFNWAAPIATSPVDRRVLYFGGNVLFRSTDGGTTWAPMSPDLTRNEKDKQGLDGGPITNEGAGGEVYNTIYWIAPSPHDIKVTYVGTDDGLVQLTRDGGATWADVTPKGVGHALTYVVEVSPHDPAKAYAVLTRYKYADETPYLFRTTDYGKTWTKITTGIPGDLITRAVREDPVRRGLLYAGTERGVYVSFNDGDRWQPLPATFPAVPVTDLQVRQGDLVVSTEGRAFWILDDISALQQMTEQTMAAAAHLYAPRRAIYLPGGGFGAEYQPGKNPFNGAHIYYHLAKAPDSTQAVRVDILDGAGKFVRTFHSQPLADSLIRPVGSAPYSKLEPKAGLNRVQWDLKSEPLRTVPGLFSDFPPDGYVVQPGTYTVRLTAMGQTVEQKLVVAPDPRATVAVADQRETDAVTKALYDRVNEMVDAVVSIREVRTQVGERGGRVAREPNGAEIQSAGKLLTGQLTAAETTLVQPKWKTFQDVVNFSPKLLSQVGFAYNTAAGAEGPVTSGLKLRVSDLEVEWQAAKREIDRLLDTELPKFNELFNKAKIPHVVVPRRGKPAQVVP
ncbi:MAG: glycosyl hydrolase [Gemmatimonadetes bacterium]|nr:glycosyl hydrolase [Gemmatimonadota bacterium]